MKKIKEFSNYNIDKEGNIYNKNKKLKPTLNNKGYLRISLSNNNSKKYYLIHRLVALHFVDNNDIENNIQVNHIDGNKLNNSATNLEWTTCKNNIKHSFLNNLSNYKGENNGRSKINDDIINKIREDFKNGIKRKELAEKYNISYSHIVSIISNKRR